VRYPSIKALLAAFPALSVEDARSIRAAMENYGRDRAMNIIDGFLGTYGVEYIPRGHNQKSPSITYCNTGETYDRTILYARGQFRIGSWGDIVERGNYD